MSQAIRKRSERQETQRATQPEEFTVGIDLGNSNSGWHGATRRASKIPTKIAYNSDQTVARWGPQVAHEEHYLHLSKLLLDISNGFPQGMSRTECEAPFKALKMEPFQVTADYLRQLIGVIPGFLTKQCGHIIAANAVIVYILTIPAIWSDAAKDATRSAAIAAGMDSVQLVTEPEAAAGFTLMSKRSLKLQVGDVFVICDAGGGTIDSIGRNGKIEFLEVVPGEGAVGGGEFVDGAFKKLLRSLLGAKGFAAFTQNKVVLKEVMDYFQKSVKELFNPLSDEASVKDFSIPFNHLFLDDEAAHMKGGRMALSCEDLRKIFDPSIDKALVVVGEQYDRATSSGQRPRGIILVRGFGQSPYLRARMTKEFAAFEDPKDNLEIIAPENGQTAIVQGAVLQAMSGGGTVVARKARLSYGIPDQPIYDPREHGRNVTVVRDVVEGVDRVKDHIFWLRKKGQDFVLGKPAKQRFRRTYGPDEFCLERAGINDLTEKLFVCDSEDPPNCTTDPRVKLLGTLKVKEGCKRVPRRAFNRVSEDVALAAQYFELPYNLRIAPVLGAMTFDFEVDGVVYGETKLKFA
ncbi:Heat shock protein 12B [Sphaceloma murrayae]|uniref:Heat shock protein 12B n=1 Tax=Sphaceloma murrayae TaxID=2082308 RepID=A0A2K1QGA1_9PEZI|nr:Heat shock protein 12B [Sphaceloma murrayae]